MTYVFRARLFLSVPAQPLPTHVVDTAFVVGPVIAVQFDVDCELGRLALGQRGVAGIQRRRFEDLVGKVCQPVEPPRLLVFFEGLPLDHTLPFPVPLEEGQLFVQRHVLQVDQGARPRSRPVPFDAQCVAPELQFIVFATPGD